MNCCVAVLSVVRRTIYGAAHQDNRITRRDATSHLVHVKKKRRAGPEDEIGVDCP